VQPEPLSQIPKLPPRPADANKGSVGRILVVGGSLGRRGMIGAPALTANAALRSGAGLVQIATERTALGHVGVLSPCSTTRPMAVGEDDIAALAVEFGADVVAIGPGLDDTVSGAEVEALLQNFSGGVVVDADALNALAAKGRWSARWPHNVVVTPHPGEMARLLAGWEIAIDATDRAACAIALAQQTGVTVVLKGAGTVVTHAERIYTNQTGNAGMATAGAGDVLTGVIAALIGQGMSAFSAAVLGVHVHGLAGDGAAEQLGRTSMIATDLIEFLPDAFCDLEYGSDD
jgi:ADP-dependent NAD(P)H-hydrate dehydratase